MSNYYLCDFLEIINNKKIEKCDMTDDDVYILHIEICYKELYWDMNVMWHIMIYIREMSRELHLRILSGLSLYS
jgi:hypothetical protein